MKKRSTDDYWIYKQTQNNQSASSSPVQSLLGLTLLIAGIIGAIVIVIAAISAWGIEGLLLGPCIIILIVCVLSAIFKH